MTKLFKVLIGIVLISMFSMANVNAASLMDAGPHDLRVVTGAELINAGVVSVDLCRYCHAPHNTDVLAPLWDRELIAPGDFTPYSSTGGTLNGTPTLAGVSGGCMSCHDGATAFDAVNSYTTGTINMTNAPLMGATGVFAPNLGTDLSNDHPIGVVLTGAGEMANAGTVTTAGLRVFGDAVECASCHDPHTATTLLASTKPKMLRLDPATQEICTVCHLK